MRRVNSLSVFLFIVVALGVFAAWFIPRLFSPADDERASQANADTAGAQRTGQTGPQAGNLSAPHGAPTPTPQPAASPQSVKVTISGSVKKENNTPEAQAVVVLYREDTRGAEPRTVNTQGGFQFDDIKLSDSNTYSLQTKSPAGCGEERFTIRDVVKTNRIERDVVLRPCQTKQADPSGAQQNGTSGDDTARQVDPQTSALKIGFEAVKSPLDSLKNSSYILALMAAVGITLLIIATYLMFLVTTHARRAAEGVRRVQELAGPEGALTRELQRIGEQEKLNGAIAELPTNLSRALKPLLDGLKAPAPLPAQPRATSADDRGGEDSGGDAPGRAATGAAHTRQGGSRARDGLSTPRAAATELYQDLLYRRGNVSPVYLNIDAQLSRRSRVESDRKICFKEAYSGFFVLFRERGDSGVGWVFPNPWSNFVPDHRWVFNWLTASNFNEQKPNISPVEVRLEDGVWQLML